VARILFCTWQYHPVVAGGAERQARLQAEELVRRGHRVTVVCPRADGVSSGTVDGVRVVRLRRLPGAWPRRLSYFANLFRFVLQHGGTYDVVHVHLANLQADAVVAAAGLRRVPTHVKVANSGMYGETRRLAAVAKVTRWYGLKHAASVQALSEETRQELLRIGVRPERIVAIPNGVPVPQPPDRAAARSRVGLPPDGKVLLFLGRFAGYKGLGDLLAAWPEVARDGWTLLLVGEEAEDEPFGPLPDLPGLLVHPWTTAPADYLAAADVFVLPSHSEGMSNALLEAMACGRAVVTSDTGAATEMVEDGVSGLVHPTGDVDALSKALDAVLSDDDLRDRLAAGARARADDFSVASVVDRLEEVYARIGRP
jgi:glycosyltransferase involved in cell wall biosynthesis